MATQHGGFESIANIPVDQIRETLRRTMVMGLPVEDSEKPTFYFGRAVAWSEHDSEGNPWDWDTAPATDVTPTSVQPVCSWEFFSPLGRQGAFPTEVGDFSPTTVVFTMFEDEYAQVNGAEYATVGPSDKRYYFRFWRPSVGLGDMTVYEIHCVAEGVE